MAIEVGTAYISILPSTSKLAPAIRKELGVIEDDAKKTGDRAGSGFGASFKAKAGMALKGLGLAGAAGVAFLGGLGVKTAAEMEQANIAFTTMLGSADKAKSFIADLNKFAAKTPFDFPGLQSAASSLISAGIATRDVLPIMKTLGDVTSGMGTGAEGIQRATIALQQMNAAGRITGEDLNQLRDAGIPVFDLLAASTGKSKAEIVKLAQAGKLGAKELGQLMDGLKSGKGLERFSGLMDKQSASLTGLWSTFQDTLGQGMAKAVKPLIPLLKDGLGGATKAVGPALESVSKALAATLKAGIDFTAWVKDNQNVIVPLIASVGVLALGLAALALQQKIAAAGGLLKFLTTATKATKAYAIVQGLLNVVMSANPIALVVLGLAALVTGLVIAYKKSETFRRIVDGAMRAVGSAFRWLWNEAVRPAMIFIGKALGFVMGLYAKMLRGLSKVPGFGWAKGAADAMQIAANKAKNLGDTLKEIKDPNLKVDRSSLDKAYQSARNLSNALGDALSNSLGIRVPAPPSIAKPPGNPRTASPEASNGGGFLPRADKSSRGPVAPPARYGTSARASSEGRSYAASADDVSRVSGSRTEFVITNWRKGEGYLREIAASTFHDEQAFRGTVRGMA